MAQSTKQALLAALSAAEGGYISGQQLAEALGVSRAAIHKAALALTAQGYALDSAPRRGYRLAGGDPFCAEAVGEYPAPIYLYDTLESSNLTAKQLALAGAPHGTLVLAGQQKAGRGRLGRRFESPAGKGVYCSLLLRPALSAADAQTATIAAAVSVARAVKALCGLELGIKWVNDLYYQGKKVCGILTEGALDLETGGLQYAIVGIGVNCFPPEGGFPEDLPEAGSVFAERPQGIEGRSQLAGAILNHFFKFYPNLAQRPFFEDYRKRSLVLGKEITVLEGNQTRTALALDLDQDFSLRVREADGTERTLSSGEVRVRPAKDRC